MVVPADQARSRLMRAWSLVALAVALAVACTLLQLFAVRPFRPPAGHGATFSGDGTVLQGSTTRAALARPPVPSAMAGRVVVRQAPSGSAAAAAGLRPGDTVLDTRSLLTGHAVDLASPPADARDVVRRWREAYRLGTRGPLEVRLRRADGSTERLRVERPPTWALPWTIWLGAVAVHLGPMVEMIAIVGAALVLLLLRTRGATALLIVSTLACAGTSTGGSLLGAELAFPPLLSAPLTVFAWLALPVTFPLIALAILYFPTKSSVLVRYPWLHAVPVAVALPMVIPAVGTAPHSRATGRCCKAPRPGRRWPVRRFPARWPGAW
jgi:hypothetical protein